LACPIWRAERWLTPEHRTGANRVHKMAGLFRQAVYGRLAGYEDVNDAERLAHDPVTGSINVQSEPGRVILDYRQRDRGGEWQPERYPVYLDTTPCHMGGERHWFLCPARGCGRRVAILYGGAIFACRHCYRLAYTSQREKPGDRAARKADQHQGQNGLGSRNTEWPGTLEQAQGDAPSHL
jgi:hypothetical protein